MRTAASNDTMVNLHRIRGSFSRTSRWNVEEETCGVHCVTWRTLFVHVNHTQQVQVQWLKEFFR